VSNKFFCKLIVLWLFVGIPPAWANNSLSIIYSGNLDGELEPCGCSAEGNFGGIKRRATLLQQLRKATPELVVLSTGGLLSSDGPGDRLKGEYILKGFAALNYDAIAVQWRDLAYGTEFAAAAKLPWVQSNLNENVDGFQARRIIKRDGKVIAYFSWLNSEDSPLRQMQGKHSLVDDSPKALRAALMHAKSQGQITVVAASLSAQKFSESVGLKNVDILIEASAYEVFGKPRMQDNTLIVQPGSRGMRLGRLDLTVNAGRIVDWKHEVLPMPTSIPDAPQMAAWYDEYNARVKADYLRRVEERKKQTAGTSPFAGEAVCQACHATQHKVWFDTQHALAYEKLEDVGKAFDPACVKCHVVGFDLPGGFFDMNITGHLMGVQCESCHGAAREHAETTGRKPVANAGWSKQKICAQCHIQKHSPGFDVDQYWPKIAH
jgi:2',3'-cyclic-nucleotide 2'-phosphodiesterase (5'-nucleotidase family)